MEEKELAARAARGDEAAAERLVRLLYPGLYRMLRALARSTADAEDLTQRATLAAVRKIGAYRGEASLRTWAGHIALTEYGRWSRRRRLTAWLSPETPDSRCALAEVEAAETLRPALLALSFPMREAFLLSALQELPLEEIAALQGVPVGTIKSRLHHARLRLRQRLEPSLPSGGEGQNVQPDPKTSQEKPHVEPV